MTFNPPPPVSLKSCPSFVTITPSLLRTERIEYECTYLCIYVNIKYFTLLPFALEYRKTIHVQDNPYSYNVKRLYNIYILLLCDIQAFQPDDVQSKDLYYQYIM